MKTSLVTDPIKILEFEYWGIHQLYGYFFISMDRSKMYVTPIRFSPYNCSQTLYECRRVFMYQIF